MILTSRQGFSLIEILVAVTIMGLAYVAILQNFSMSSRGIFSMEEGRAKTLATSMAFEQTLLFMDVEGQEKDTAGAEVVASGGSYDLELVRDEDDEFMTLKLKKK